MALKTIKEIANKYNVTTMAVRNWIKKYGIPTNYERVIGVKPRIVINESLLQDIFRKKDKDYEMIGNLKVFDDDELCLKTKDELICQKCNKKFIELWGYKESEEEEGKAFCFKCFREHSINSKTKTTHFLTCIIRNY